MHFCMAATEGIGKEKSITTSNNLSNLEKSDVNSKLNSLDIDFIF